MDLTKCLSTHNANDHNTYAPTMSMANMKRLKLPKGLSEFANRRTETTIAKKKKDKRTNNHLQNTTRKTNDRGTRTLLNKTN